MKLNTKKTATYFKTRFTLTESSDGWYRISDPFDNHKDKSMAVNFYLDKVIGFRSGFRGTLKEFIKEYENTSGQDAIKLVETFTEDLFAEPKEIKIKTNTENVTAKWPDEFTPLEIYNKRIYNYIQSRNLDIDYLIEKGFGYCTKGHYAFNLIAPFYVDNILKYWQGRTVMKYVEPKYRFPLFDYCPVTKSQLWYNQDIIKWETKLYITEGWTDAETFDTGIASSSWKVSADQMRILLKRIKYLDELIIVSDRGWYTHQIKQWLYLADDVKIKVLNLDNAPFKDANQGGIEAILKIEENTKYLNITNLIDLL